MPYEPGQHQPTLAERSRAFKAVPIGFAAALFATGMHIFVPNREIPGLVVGVAIWGPVLGILSGGKRSDEFLDALCIGGMRFLSGFIAIYLFLTWFCLSIFAASSHSPVATKLFADGLMVALLASLSFYVGYSYAWLRDRY